VSGSDRFLLYGSYGYTGRLVARLAGERGLEPVLAGRDEEALREQAGRDGLRYVLASLDDPAALDRALTDLPLVFHCAGPFSRTFRPMVEACLRSGCHYLDVTGEIDVFSAAAELDRQARDAGVMLLPGVGFDVVPTDCLAVLLKSRLPSATRLTLAVLAGAAAVSRGTALSMAEQLGKGGFVRRAGRLVPVPAGWKGRSFDFGTGPRPAVTIPFGDLVTAYHSTGIGEIEVYGAGPPSLRHALRITGHLGWLLQSGPVHRLIELGIRRRVTGPSAVERASGETRIYGEVTDDEGHSASAVLVGPEAYDFTALTVLAVLERALRGEAPPGFQTPAKAYGPDLALEIEGVDVMSRDFTM
jgi:short subunit dehydrogenase-like uncharacterized protein